MRLPIEVVSSEHVSVNTDEAHSFIKRAAIEYCSDGVLHNCSVNVWGTCCLDIIGAGDLGLHKSIVAADLPDPLKYALSVIHCHPRFHHTHTHTHATRSSSDTVAREAATAAAPHR